MRHSTLLCMPIDALHVDGRDMFGCVDADCSSQDWMPVSNLEGVCPRPCCVDSSHFIVNFAADTVILYPSL